MNDRKVNYDRKLESIEEKLEILTQKQLELVKAHNQKLN